MSPCVLDASALLAWLWDEPGADVVDPVLSEALMSTVNWSETAQKLARRGSNPRTILHRVTVLGVSLAPFTPEDALATADLWAPTRSADLSLGDRACLSLARARGLTALTADTAWSTSNLDTPVQLIR